MSALDQPLRSVVGAKTAKPMADSLGLHTVGDLLRYYPRRYDKRGELTRLNALEVGEHVTVVAKVVSSKKIPMRQRKGTVTKLVVTDGHGQLEIAFFSRGGWFGGDLLPGRTGLFTGTVTRFNQTRQLTHPQYKLLEDLDEAGAERVARSFVSLQLVIYPASKDITTWQISDAVALVLHATDEIEDPLPEGVRVRHGLLPWAEAIQKIHRPQSDADIEQARRRLAWDEAMVLQVALARRRAEAALVPTTPRVARAGGLVDAFRSRLPFTLTAGQAEVDQQLRADLAGTVPMHRLLQGEVGSGKTVVALLAMLAVVDAGGQAALLAPTEVLALQHHRSISAMLGPLADGGRLGGSEEATRVALLTGSQNTAARREALLEAASGQAGIVVGTHALLEERVQFADLGLVVVDEQHRFGVHQRDALRAKGSEPPHLLVMTATPIPRTVAMTVFGDLEVSSLTELPAGRSPIRSFVVPAASPAWVDRMWAKVREEVAAGHQAYVVCARIGEGVADIDELEPDEDSGGDQRRPPAAVLDVLPQLVDGQLTGLRVAALHGRMPPADKDDVMSAFANGRLDVLVATTVIEVGVDVPNATVMAVLDADRFGMSQLHQLRGRIGRGTAPGVCLLETSTEPGSPTHERLVKVASTVDGFELARFDLETRREGDVLGASQSGRRKFLKMLELSRHEELISQARDEATAIVAEDPDLSAHPALAQALADALDPERSEYLERA
ncbi:MAG: ATP-dependent helicase RecG [Frankiales bacterium]|nr:ATP-dependent helicase RecG [Frankiales bacterium]